MATLATLDRVTSEPGLRALCNSMMAEAQAITASQLNRKKISTTM